MSDDQAKAVVGMLLSSGAILHADSCPYWEKIAARLHREAIESCDCGVGAIWRWAGTPGPVSSASATCSHESELSTIRDRTITIRMSVLDAVSIGLFEFLQTARYDGWDS